MVIRWKLPGDCLHSLRTLERSFFFFSLHRLNRLGAMNRTSGWNLFYSSFAYSRKPYFYDIVEQGCSVACVPLI